MNDELKKKLLEMLTAAQKAGGDAYDYMLREAPELAREVVLWNAIECAFALLAGLLCLIASGWFIKQLRSSWKEWDNHCDVRGIFYPLMLAGLLIAGCITTYNSATALLRAYYTPRVFFLLSCKDLLK